MKRIVKTVTRSILEMVSQGWEPYSRLMLAGDDAGWVLDWEMREVRRIARHLGIRLASSRWRNRAAQQSIFFASQFFLLNDGWLNMSHRVGFSYFHGLPGSGEPLFDRVYEALCEHHRSITRIQASHKQMRDLILQSGIDPEKVHLIPIGINLDFFPMRGFDEKRHVREELGIPHSAFVIGSFQKDGVGWGAGDQPKLIKGPDVFLSTIKALKASIPELYILLSGPARGYVKQGLEEMRVPYQHLYLEAYPKIGKLYKALDLYLVSSRQEGGPKAVLESMASGVPIISTRVGQAADLIAHGQNGWLADIEDVSALVHWSEVVYGLGDSDLAPILAKGHSTGEANSYTSQIPLWAAFMKGFVLCRP
jgi:glycosyltransferase involved in cell wall biosynthesis